MGRNGRLCVVNVVCVELIGVLPNLLSDPVNSRVSSNGVNPGVSIALTSIIIASLSPHLDHGFLDKLFDVFRVLTCT